MVAEPGDAVTFSDLSRNPRAVAERARRLGRLRVTHRDADDFYLTAADREEERDENLVTASRMFAALSRSASGALAVAEVFPWVRHLSGAERAEFASELTGALSDAAELDIDMSSCSGSEARASARWRVNPACISGSPCIIRSRISAVLVRPRLPITAADSSTDRAFRELFSATVGHAQ